MKLFNTKQAAQLIADLTGRPISTRQIQHEIKNGNLEAQKIGHDYVLEESSIKNYQRRKPGKKSYLSLNALKESA